MNETNQTDRRGWLRTCTRWTALAGVAGISGHLLVYPEREDGQPCGPRLPCRQCGVFSRCRLPKAAAARRRLQG